MATVMVRADNPLADGINYVRTAVDYLGGPTKTGNVLGVSNVTVHTWINKGFIYNRDKAVKLGKLTKMDPDKLRGFVAKEV